MMLLPEFSVLWQAWLEIESAGSKTPIPAYANPRNLRTDGVFVWLELSRCPESSAVMQGMLFAEGQAFTGFFECKLSSTSGFLKTASGKNDYSIDANDLKTCLFSAYYVPSADAKEAVEVAIVEEFSGPRQIMIFDGGKIAASQDLIGKTIKVSVVYPKTIVMTNQRVEFVYLHLIGEDKSGKPAYAAYSGCTIKPVSGLLEVKLGELAKHEILDSKVS